MVSMFPDSFLHASGTNFSANQQLKLSVFTETSIQFGTTHFTEIQP